MAVEAAWMAAMRAGRFEAAWRIADAVLATRDPATRNDPRTPLHRRWVWDGRPWAGRDVLVRCYHGLGDTLQYVRYAALLRREARRVTVQAQPELLALLRTAPGVDAAVPLGAPDPPHEVDLEASELPHACRVTLADIPAAVPYLRAPRRVLPGGAFNIGICWAAGGWRPGRSLPLAAFASLAGPGAQLWSLQRGPAQADLAHLGAPTVANPDETSTDVMATAALIRGLDLVVTVDTMVAHLAGALGVPTLLLLRGAPDWRWMLRRADTPWYPTMRLWRL